MKILRVCHATLHLSDGSTLVLDDQISTGESWLLQGSTIQFEVGVDDESSVTVAMIAIPYEGEINPLDKPEPVESLGL